MGDWAWILVSNPNMEKNPVNKGVISDNFSGVGAVSTSMIHKRAKELAFLAARPGKEPTDADFEQAARELSGGSDLDSSEELIESLPESERWDPVPGSAGQQAPELENEDEDDSEGRNESAQLAEGGAREAEHDQMLQAEESAREDEKDGRKKGR
jgi:hypothetical protein